MQVLRLLATDVGILRPLAMAMVQLSVVQIFANFEKSYLLTCKSLGVVPPVDLKVTESSFV